MQGAMASGLCFCKEPASGSIMHGPGPPQTDAQESQGAGSPRRAPEWSCGGGVGTGPPRIPLGEVDGSGQGKPPCR